MTQYLPADVPTSARQTFDKNYQTITKNTGHLFLFAGDQKIEHLNDDFDGANISADAAHPCHLFKIAQQPSIGAFATHLGLIARYANNHKQVPYIAKLNGKTNIVPTTASDPYSHLLWNVQNAVALRQAGINICGVGYTIYLGSAHEGAMLAEAAQQIFQAHQNGLVAIVWVYPRGAHVHDPLEPRMLMGAAGIANALGADFVKLAVPSLQGNPSGSRALEKAVQAAGNTKIICSGGPHIDATKLLEETMLQQTCGARGCAIGRNLFQRSLDQAHELADAIAQIVYQK